MRLIILSVILVCSAILHAETFHIRANGADVPGRDGSDPDSSAWATLGYAARRLADVPGALTIEIGPGTFHESEQTVLGESWTVRGAGPEATVITAPDGLTPADPGGNHNTERQKIVAGSYLIRANAPGSIRDLTLRSRTAKRVQGAVIGWNSSGLLIDNVRFENFRACGIYLEGGSSQTVNDCHFFNCGMDVKISGSQTAALWTRHTEDLRVTNNVFRTTFGNGYGYRGRSHTRALIEGNIFDNDNKNFAIEIAHENEYGVTIRGNVLRNCFSFPKKVNQTDPKTKGETHSILFTGNFSTSSYCLEGSRGFVEVSYNFNDAYTDADSRFWTDYNGIQTSGFVRIHHNIAVNLPRSFLYFETKPGRPVRVDNVQVWHNTASFGEIGGSFIEFSGSITPEKSLGWDVRNNVAIGLGKNDSFLHPKALEMLDAPLIRSNLGHQLKSIPEGNVLADPGLNTDYSPSGVQSAVVDKGESLGLPFTGNAPDLGAVELGGDAPSFSPLVEWSINLGGDRWALIEKQIHGPRPRLSTFFKK